MAQSTGRIESDFLSPFSPPALRGIAVAGTRRLYGVLQKRLGEAEYLAGADYSIADMATFPWVARFEWHKVDLADFPAVKAWYDKLYTRAAVKKGMAVPTPP
jgi:glutathione S-transferase